MLHLHACPESNPAPRPYAEAVARLASIRHALRLVDSNGGGPAPDPEADEAFGLAWQEAPAARRRCCDARAGRVIAGTAAGLDALLAAGERPNPAASRKLAEEIRAGLEEICAVLRDTPAPARHDPLAL
ncbi:MAG TPA: hypothetical protein VM265_05790 [Sphingomicrobium sp.]|nr:hypothetical protein [Sphingomicrobium sp.]